MAEIEPLWCVVANMRPEAFGRATSTGTKQFKAGALLWVVTGYWGTGFERVNVIGHHRTSKRLIAIVVEAERLTHWRAKPAYQPALMRKLREHVPALAWKTKEDCEERASLMNERFPPVVDLKGEIDRKSHALHLLDTDERGRELERMAAAALALWTQQLRQESRVPPAEVGVLADWLEDRGVPITIDELVRTLDRRRAF